MIFVFFCYLLVFPCIFIVKFEFLRSGAIDWYLLYVCRICISSSFLRLSAFVLFGIVYYAIYSAVYYTVSSS